MRMKGDHERRAKKLNEEKASNDLLSLIFLDIHSMRLILNKGDNVSLNK